MEKYKDDEGKILGQSIIAGILEFQNLVIWLFS